MIDLRLKADKQSFAQWVMDWTRRRHYQCYWRDKDGHGTVCSVCGARELPWMGVRCTRVGIAFDTLLVAADDTPPEGLFDASDFIIGTDGQQDLSPVLPQRALVYVTPLVSGRLRVEIGIKSSGPLFDFSAALLGAIRKNWPEAFTEDEDQAAPKRHFAGRKGDERYDFFATQLYEGRRPFGVVYREWEQERAQTGLPKNPRQAFKHAMDGRCPVDWR
jgi:hypothetical protein